MLHFRNRQPLQRSVWRSILTVGSSSSSDCVYFSSVAFWLFSKSGVSDGVCCCKTFGRLGLLIGNSIFKMRELTRFLPKLNKFYLLRSGCCCYAVGLCRWGLRELLRGVLLPMAYGC